MGPTSPCSGPLHRGPGSGAVPELRTNCRDLDDLSVVASQPRKGAGGRMALEGGGLFLILSIRGETPTVPRFAAGRLPPPSARATIPPSQGAWQPEWEAGCVLVSGQAQTLHGKLRGHGHSAQLSFRSLGSIPSLRPAPGEMRQDAQYPALLRMETGQRPSPALPHSGLFKLTSF